MGWLQWQWALTIAGGALVIGLAWRTAVRPWQRNVAAFARELALVLVLYSIWILAGSLSVARTDEGLVNGRWVYRVQNAMALPSETILQNWIVPHPLVARFTNAYYAVVHVPAMMIALVWLFLAHRERYSQWRIALALTTFACLCIQFVPVAPPRMYPQFGFVDVAARFDQSVYGPIGQGISDQISAMPSVHVAWAAFVGAAVVHAGVSPWRWLILAHPAATIFAVTATANHWWLDGAVAIVLLAMAVGIERSVARAVQRARSGRSSAEGLDAGRLGETTGPRGERTRGVVAAHEHVEWIPQVVDVSERVRAE